MLKTSTERHTTSKSQMLAAAGTAGNAAVPRILAMLSRVLTGIQLAFGQWKKPKNVRFGSCATNSLPEDGGAVLYERFR